jgi:hypothetical protein
MASTIVDDRKAALDMELQTAPAHAGIAFGLALYCEFAERGWLSMENFGALGTELFKGKLPAYSHTFCVCVPGVAGD